MLVKYFRKDTIEVYAVFVLLSLAIWAKALMGIGEWEPVRTLEYGTPVELLINRISISSPYISTYAAFLITILVLVMMQRLNNRFIFVPQRSTVPALLYIIIAFSFTSLQHLSPALTAMPLLILSLNSLIGSYRKEYAEGEYFLASFFVALAAIVYLPSLAFVLMIMVSILVMRPFSWREWVTMLAGLLVPLLFVVTYYLFFDSDALNNLLMFDPAKVIAAIPKTMNSFFGYGFLATLTVAFVYSLFFIFSWVGTQKVRTNKVFLVFFSMVIICLLAYLLIPTVSKDIMLVVALPLSYIIGVFFIFTRRTLIADGLLLAILALSVLLQLFVE